MKKIDKLKEELTDGINILLGAVKPTDLKRWVPVNERSPVSEGYYIVLRGNSNPNFIHTCHPAVHFWYGDEQGWSSETEYWLEDVNSNKFKKSPLHDKEKIITILDNLEPDKMCKLVDFLNSLELEIKL